MLIHITKHAFIRYNERMKHKITTFGEMRRIIRNADFQQLSATVGIYSYGRATFVVKILPTKHIVKTVIDTPTLSTKERLINRLLKRD